LSNTIIPRRRSLALDEAAAAELRSALGVGEEALEDGDETPVPEVDVEGELEKKKAEVVGKGLAKYASKEGGKKGKKKVEELGPSGLSYTPLEKQYMEIKAKWPDVLLLTEGGCLLSKSSCDER